jgi:hypothetical protein
LRRNRGRGSFTVRVETDRGIGWGARGGRWNAIRSEVHGSAGRSCAGALDAALLLQGLPQSRILLSSRHLLLLSNPVLFPSLLIETGLRH